MSALRVVGTDKMREETRRKKPVDRIGGGGYIGRVNGILNLLLSNALLLCGAAVGL